jgi:spermidine synthase
MLRYLAQGYSTNLQDVLCIGLGVGIVPRDLAAAGAQVDVIEINPKVIEVGRKFFDLEPSKLNIHIGDGRYFVNKSTRQYDAVILDAFLGDSSPSHLMTREAFANMRKVLRPNGVLVINSFGDFTPGNDFFVSSLFKTLSAVFTSVKIHSTGNGNVFFVASANPELALRALPITDANDEDMKNQIEVCMGSLMTVDSSSGRILTDDYNPVDFYDASNREMHRRKLAFSIQRL